MMIIKPRKFRARTKWQEHSIGIFDILDALHIQHIEMEAPYDIDVLETYKQNILSMNWDINKALVMPVKAPGRRRLALIINDITFEKLVDAINRAVKLKAFL
jgi:hypothetical protein